MADGVVVVQDIRSVARSAAKRDRECLGVESRTAEWTFGGEHREHLPQRLLVDRLEAIDPTTAANATVEPTDKSMPRVKITSSMPIDSNEIVAWAGS